MSKELKEGLKELGRTVLMAVVSYFLTDGVLNTALQAFLQSRLDATQIVVLSGLLTSVFSGIDKMLHKQDRGLLGNGLTGF